MWYPPYLIRYCEVTGETFQSVQDAAWIDTSNYIASKIGSDNVPESAVRDLIWLILCFEKGPVVYDEQIYGRTCEQDIYWDSFKIKLSNLNSTREYAISFFEVRIISILDLLWDIFTLLY